MLQQNSTWARLQCLRIAVFCLVGFVFVLDGYAVDRMRVATGGYSPSIPPYVTFAVPSLTA
jgi:hypothetical protein